MKFSRSFFKGFGKAIVICSYKRTEITNPNKDFEFLRGDWERVGESIESGIRKYKAATEYK